MKYPTLAEMQNAREYTDVFLGYNHNLRIGEGEFYDMRNLTGDNYPVLSPRAKRGVYISEATTPRGLIAKDSLCYIDGENFYINKYEVPLKLRIDYDEEGKVKPKQLISMGAYVIIMPDKKYVNTNDFETDYGDIEARFTTTEDVVFSMSRSDGTNYGNEILTQATHPEITEEMLSDPTKIPLWIDTSSLPHTLKQYSTSTETWAAVATTYVKIASRGIGEKFEINDAVTISGVTDSALATLNATLNILSKGNDYIVVTGLIDKVTTQTEPLEIVRRMPDMDFIVESNNRLWGCRYGIQGSGASAKIVNEIYACKLGDFKNWNSFLGTAADSYAVTVGTDGKFTGAVTYLGYPIFFKEGYMHKIYGNYPANYQVQTTACRGVQNGCDRSIAIVNEVLYYKARSGICAFSGSLPVEISGALGDAVYDNAVAGNIGNKYYVSMRNENIQYHMFVYDTKKGTWHREDDTEAVMFCNCRGDLYYIDYATKQIKTVRGTGIPEPNEIRWEAVTGYIGTDTPDKKYISSLDVRMMLDVGAKVSFYAEYDSCGNFEHLFNMTGVSLKSFPVAIKPKRCDHLRLKIEGEGDAKIFSICKTVEWGSNK